MCAALVRSRAPSPAQDMTPGPYHRLALRGAGAAWAAVVTGGYVCSGDSGSILHCTGDMERSSTAGIQPGDSVFYYFAYGSNLLRERILLDNPSALFHSIALLKDFKLAFGNHKGIQNSRWHGGAATVVESEGDKVWGVVWKMDISSLDSLDIQEGVNGGIYQPIEISVQTADGELVCRCYKMNKCIYGLTSPQYKQVMCMGAKQNDLPMDYQKMLGEIETNNYSGPIPIMDKLKDALQKVQDDG